MKRRGPVKVGAFVLVTAVVLLVAEKAFEVLLHLVVIRFHVFRPRPLGRRKFIIAHDGLQNPPHHPEMTQSMRENGIEPNEFSYTAAANACARTGDWEGALRLLQQMRDRDEIEPNEFTYTAAVRAPRSACLLSFVFRRTPPRRA